MGNVENVAFALHGLSRDGSHPPEKAECKLRAHAVCGCKGKNFNRFVHIKTTFNLEMSVFMSNIDGYIFLTLSAL